MNSRSISAFSLLAIFCACGNNVTGQKDRAALKTSQDSVSYGLGNQIGRTLKDAAMDSINVDAMAQGIRDVLDSSEKMTPEQVGRIVQAYQMKAQRTLMEKERKSAEENLRKGEAFLMENGKKQGVVSTASGLQYEILQAGTGPKPTGTSEAKVNHRGTLIDGIEFDSSYKYGQPSQFKVDEVMLGWTEALMLMPTGSRWKLYVPADLAYGATRGPGGALPPYSTLIFEVELLEVAK